MSILEAAAFIGCEKRAGVNEWTGKTTLPPFDELSAAQAWNSADSVYSVRFHVRSAQQ